MNNFKYEIDFYLDIDIKNMLDENNIKYSFYIIDKEKYCLVEKNTTSLHQQLSDENLCIKLLGIEYSEFLTYTCRVRKNIESNN